MPKRSIKIVGPDAFVPLTKGKVAVIDADDVGIIEGRNWTATQGNSGIWYAVNRTVTPNYMHGFLLGLRADHVDGDGLNNRRSNLREANHTQNGWNRKINSSNKSGYKGVSIRANGLWTAQICVFKKVTHLGFYGDKIDAAVAYDEAARKHFGKFARLNFPNGPPTKPGDQRP